MTKYTINNNDFIQLYKLGLNNKEIALELKVPHYTISKYMSKRNIRSNKRQVPLDIVNEGKDAKCSKCNEIKPIDQYQYGRKGYKYEYRFSYCNKCRKQQSYASLDRSIETYLKNRHNILKARCKKKKIELSLTYDELVCLYYEQSGLCFYTDTKLEWGTLRGKLRESLSIDRIDHTQGYSLNNVVLCTHKINTVKSDLSIKELEDWIPSWYARLKKANKI